MQTQLEFSHKENGWSFFFLIAASKQPAAAAQQPNTINPKNFHQSTFFFLQNFFLFTLNTNFIGFSFFCDFLCIFLTLNITKFLQIFLSTKFNFFTLILLSEKCRPTLFSRYARRLPITARSQSQISIRSLRKFGGYSANHRCEMILRLRLSTIFRHHWTWSFFEIRLNFLK